MRSFRDPNTDVLKAFGFMEANEPGDVSKEEGEDFALAPGAWKWNGSDWEPCERTGGPVIDWPGIQW